MVSDTSGKDEWQEILNKALEGDSEALGILCQDYLQPKVYAFAMNMLKNPQDAEDTVQDVFARLLENRGKIRNHVLDSFEAFVIRITKNACIDYSRKHKYTELIAEEHRVQETTKEEIAQKEILTLLCATIHNKLSEDEQKIFEMKAIEELPYRTISESTGVKLTTLYAQYQRLLMKIGENDDLLAYWNDSQL